MVQATAVAAALPGWAAAKEVVGQAYAAENTFDIYQRIAMQRSRTQPPKPADKPGGSWVLTSFRPSGCAPPLQMLARFRECRMCAAGMSLNMNGSL